MFSYALTAAAALASWILQVSPTSASLRGVSVVSPEIIWASGSQGTWLLTTDSGKHWQTGTVAGAAGLDFRDIQAWSASEALLLSSGEAAQSRVYRTADRGRHWDLLFTNPDPKGFFDAFAFWDRQHGVLLGDPVDGRFAVFTTTDGGKSWNKQLTPVALRGEGAFAASGTCLTVNGKTQAWFGTGGGARARIFRSSDGGHTWSAAITPLVAGTPSAGVFSVAFRNTRQGIAVGGDYRKPGETARTLAFSRDGGKSWQSLAGPGLSGFRSAVAFALLSGAAASWIAVGTSGSDVSHDAGQSWKSIPAAGLNAVAAASDGTAWAVGAHGLIAKIATR